MATLTRLACSCFPVRASCFLIVAALSACRATPVPTLGQAFQDRGDAAARAKTFMLVAIRGRENERARAAFLWGLFACDARAPVAGLAGFNVARPDGGRSRLAARRLEDALDASRSPASAWTAAAGAPWLSDGDRARLRLRGAEALSLRGETAAATALLPGFGALRREDVARALVVVARVGGDAGASALRSLAVEFPQQAAGLLSPEDLARLAAGFTTGEWALHAEALLDAGQPSPALRAASRAGSAGFIIAARASSRLHRPSAALALAARGGERCGECWVERAEAQRQLSWGAASGDRRRAFAEMLRAAARASQVLPGGDPLRPKAELLQAEALVELGRFADAAPHLAGEAVASQPRFEWVCRRLAMLGAATMVAASGQTAELAHSTRGRRLAAFWIARERARRGDVSGFEALATGGFPDLPAQWATWALGRRGVPVAVSDDRPAIQPPPVWAGDLMAVGRVADVVLGWRAELEASGGSSPGWLGLVRLAAMPPLEGISLLVRGEPRLLSGPWQGLSRELMERYLPLPWRDQVESAAQRAGVPAWVLAGLVRQESAWNPRARSVAGALGLAQLLPAVAAEAAREVPGLAPTGDLFDPGRNLILGATLLARWRQGFAGTLDCGAGKLRRRGEAGAGGVGGGRARRRAHVRGGTRNPRDVGLRSQSRAPCRGLPHPVLAGRQDVPMDVIEVGSQRRRQLVDVTSFVQEAVAASGVEQGLCHVAVPHTTAAVMLNENADPAVGDDILAALGAMLPPIAWRHGRELGRPPSLHSRGPLRHDPDHRGRARARPLAGRLPVGTRRPQTPRALDHLRGRVSRERRPRRRERGGTGGRERPGGWWSGRGTPRTD